MMPVLWKWPVPVSGLCRCFGRRRSGSRRRCRRRNRFKRYGKGMILLDIGKCVAVRIFRHRQIQAVHRELREPEAFVCRVGNGFFLSAGNFPALGHRAMLRRGSGNREQIRHPGAVELHVPSPSAFVTFTIAINSPGFVSQRPSGSLMVISSEKPKSTVSSASSVFCESEYVWIKFPIPRCIVSGKRKKRSPETQRSWKFSM